MDQAALLFIIKALSVALIVLPYWLYRTVLGLPFDDDAETVRYGAFAKWAMLVMWLVFIGIAFLLGGVDGVLILFGVLAGLALLWAAIVTPAQSIWPAIRGEGDNVAQATISRPFNQRFVANFRAALVELPARFLDGM